MTFIFFKASIGPWKSTDMCKKDLPGFLAYLSAKMFYGHAAMADTSVLYQLFSATVVCFFLKIGS